MEKAPDKEHLIIECAHFLKQKEILEKKSWQKFSAQFFKYYKNQILIFYGYQPQEAGEMLVRVGNRQFFLAVMSALCKTRTIDDSQKALSKVLYACFDLKLELSTIEKLVSEILSEYNALFNYIAKYKKNDF